MAAAAGGAAGFVVSGSMQWPVQHKRQKLVQGIEAVSPTNIRRS